MFAVEFSSKFIDNQYLSTLAFIRFSLNQLNKVSKLSQNAEELFECVWPFCGVGA